MVDESPGDDGRLAGQRPVDEVELAKQMERVLVKDPFGPFSVKREGNSHAWPAGRVHGIVDDGHARDQGRCPEERGAKLRRRD